MSDPSSLRRKLDYARRDLLDLTARNRLIHTPRGRSGGRSIEVVDERADEVFGKLVAERKPMGLRPVPETHHEEGVTSGAEPIAGRTTDAFLQTRLPPEALQKRLLSIFYDARTFQEEQGVNILYLAVGFLRWRDPVTRQDRDAPLLLVPISLERQNVASRFRLRADDEETTTNLSLQAKLKGEFMVELPEVPPREELTPSAYFEAVAAAIAGQPDWSVRPDDMVLGFFSFSKFLMYRDLDPENWADDRRLDAHPAIVALLEAGFRSQPPLCGDDDPIDPLVTVAAAAHVVDADSSQTIVIEEIKQGRNLVVQGPPGTGKSQTIANAIALAVREGKSVLFVAEKMAALEVVKRRLDNIGLGAMCLELHSHKARKAAVLEDLAETMQVRRPKRANAEKTVAELQSRRDQLNAVVAGLHGPIEPAGLSAYRVLGELVRLRADGVGAAQFTLGDAARWLAAEVQERARLVADVAEHLRDMGLPNEHPWRGVMLDALLPMDVDRLIALLPEVGRRMSEAISAADALASALGVRSPAAPRDIGRLARLAQRAAKLPDIDIASLADSAWMTQRDEISRIVEDARKLRAGRQKLSDVVTEAAWITDVTRTRRDLAAYGRSWFRWFNRDYRRAIAELAGLLQFPPPRKLAARLDILDTLAAAQNLRWSLDVNQARVELGRRAFGTHWRGSDSDWEVLTAIDAWESECRRADVPAEFRTIMAAIRNRSVLAPLADQAARSAESAVAEFRGVADALKLDLKLAFGSDDIQDLPLVAARDRLAGWPAQTEKLSRWTAYRARWSQLAGQGLRDLANLIHQGDVTADTALDAFWMAYYEELLRHALARHPQLASFDGASHERLIAEFRRLDQERILLARREIAARHHSQIPSDEFGVGEVGVLMREINKKRRHLPLRQLLKQAGHAVQALKPVFMMSPISVAQFLEPGVLKFDLLLVDEASQIRPVDALGAIARASQMVVVGDERQLPPTRFFDKVLDDADEPDPDETPATRDLESILGLCAAQGMAQRMLRWHYRSRHHTLIAVSNREFYRNRLYVVPNPETTSVGNGLRAVPQDDHRVAASLGLKFHHLPQARFDRGKTATNRDEAQAVAQAVMTHIERFPGTSLGVGAFSVAQRDAILDELETLRQANPDAEPFFVADRPEPFFVKNLENIQGDERDVVFMSVGYGRDAEGKLAMHFGPLSNEGGERRLNVLITRARLRCEVFSSITADDIDLGRTTAIGAQALKTFLAYARTGELAQTEPPVSDADSVFERQVAAAVRELGHEVQLHVGSAGLFVDLAVVDPDRPNRFLLGIECDGASYRSARSARDRERLRRQVLEDRGWVIHRVWSSDWFRRPQEQLRAIAAAIERAKAAWAQHDAESRVTCPEPAKGVESASTSFDDSMRATREDSLAVPYEEAAFDVPEIETPVHELSPARLAQVVTRIVRIEGPVHRDEIARRVATLWQAQRTGRRIVDAVEQALAKVVDDGKLTSNGPFFDEPGRNDVPVRSREAVESATLRKPEMLPPAEIQAALLAVVRAQLGVPRDDLVTEAARLLGFKLTGPQLRETIEAQVDLMRIDQRLTERDDKLYAPTFTPRETP